MSSNVVSRRAFLRLSALATGAAAVAGRGAKPAASASPVAQPTVAQSPSPQAPAAKKGRVIIKFALEGEPRNLNYLSSVDNYTDLGVGMVVADPLLEFATGEQFKVIPALATSWKWVDNKTFDFSLRKGVKFASGKPLTMEDVKYSLEYMLDEKNGSRWRSALLPVQEIKIKDDYSGSLVLKAPYAPLDLYALQSPRIAPKGIGDGLLINPDGTGPFKLKEWVKGQSLIYVKNENYWVKGKPAADELHMVVQTEYQTRLSSLRSKQIDFVFDIAPPDIPMLEKEPGLKVTRVPLANSFLIVLNTKRPPFDDVNVRQAVRCAIDKKLMADTGQGGFGKPTVVNMPSESAYYPRRLEYERSLEKAKEYLSRAGKPNGVEAEFLVMIHPRVTPLGDAAAYGLKEVGINFKIIRLEAAQFMTRFLANKDYQAAITGEFTSIDPDAFHYRYFHSKGSSNIAGYANPEVDKLLDDARSITDTAKRKALYNQMYEQVYLKDVPVVSTIQAVRTFAMSADLKGLGFHPLWRWDYSGITRG